MGGEEAEPPIELGEQLDELEEQIGKLTLIQARTYCTLQYLTQQLQKQKERKGKMKELEKIKEKEMKDKFVNKLVRDRRGKYIIGKDKEKNSGSNNFTTSTSDKEEEIYFSPRRASTSPTIDSKYSFTATTSNRKSSSDEVKTPTMTNQPRLSFKSLSDPLSYRNATEGGGRRGSVSNFASSKLISDQVSFKDTLSSIKERRRASLSNIVKASTEQKNSTDDANNNNNADD